MTPTAKTTTKTMAPEVMSLRYRKRETMVGTTIVELTDISGNIVIDSALQEAYKGTTLMNDHMSGDFPVLKPGQNAVSWSGNVTRVIVRPNWRYL